MTDDIRETCVRLIESGAQKADLVLLLAQIEMARDKDPDIAHDTMDLLSDWVIPQRRLPDLPKIETLPALPDIGQSQDAHIFRFMNSGIASHYFAPARSSNLLDDEPSDLAARPGNILDTT